jgi:glycosyltransferase involved in cell wall biosynthesis
MRILHVINSLNPQEGGTVECVRQIGTAVRAVGHTVEVVACKDTALDSWIDSFPFKVHALGPGIGKYAFSAKLRGWLLEFGRQYDVWIINGLWQYQGVCASRAAGALRIPYFVYAHGMLDPWSRRAHPLKYFKKLAYWLAIERSTLQRAQAVLFTSEEEARLAPGFFDSLNWRPIVVGNGVAEPPVQDARQTIGFRDKYGLAGTRPIWLFLSRLHPKKGIENLLAALPGILSKPNAPIVVIAGGGDIIYQKDLRALAKRLGIESDVIWTGPLYGAEKWAAFNLAELFILPSHQENFGIVVAEALSVGLPVCITRQVNIWPAIVEGGAGLVCNDDQAALDLALKHWIHLGAEEKSEFRRRARQCFEDNFQIDAAATRLLEAIQFTLKKPGTGVK